MHLLRQSPPARSRSALSHHDSAPQARTGFSPRRILRNAARLSAVLALSISAACNDKPTESGALALVVAPTGVTATPGAPGVATINVTRGGTFTGDVTLTAENLPAGVTAAFSPATLSSGVATSSIAVSAATTASAGSATITIRASGAGVTSRTATLQVTINPSSVTLTSGSTSATTPQGLSATIPLTIVRNGGFTGSVDLAAFSLPTGVTANFSPTTLGAGVTTSTLTLNVPSNASIGTSTFTIRASGGGIAEQLLQMQLIITAGAQPNFTLTATPAAMTVTPGNIATTTININRTGGYIDNVGFITSQLPTGVVATFNPNPANANTATLSLATTALATPGTHTITISGSGGAVGPRTVDVMLTVNPPANFTIALNPLSTSVNAGGSVQNTLTVTRIGGYAGDITFAGQNLPNGITVAFSPATLSGTATTTTATISAAANVGPGFYTITLRANGVGNLLNATATLNVTVIAPLSFGVSLVSSNVSIARGGSGNLSVNITRNGGYTGPVNLAVSGLPAAITATPVNATGANATVAISVGATASPGTYSGVLEGTAQGLPSTATNFTVTVTGGGGGGGGGSAILWQFCSATTLPVFMAVRDGPNGTWTRVVGNFNNLYTFDITQSVGSVFIVKPNGGGFATTIYQMTRTELEETAANECSVNTVGTKSFTGSVASLGALETATITMGGGSGTAVFGSLNYSLTNVLNGAQDLVALRNVIGMSGITTDKILIRRNLNLTSGSVIAPIDFASSEAFAPATAQISLGNLGSDNAILTTTYQTQNGGSVSLGTPSTGSSATRTVFGVPASQMAGNDRHLLLAAATSVDNSSIRAVFNYVGGIGDQSVTFGSVLNQPSVTSTTNTVSRPRAQGAFQSDYPTAVGIAFTQSAGNSVTINESAGYSGNGTYDLNYPDLTHIQQFDPLWGLLRSTTTNYTITGTSATAGAPLGTTFRTGSRVGSIISSAIRR